MSNELSDQSEPSIKNLVLALSLLYIDPEHLRGVVIKARASPVREKLQSALKELFKCKTQKRIYPSISDSVLYGELDFTRTLDAGKPINTLGYFEEKSAIFSLMMAERMDPSLAAKCASALDSNKHFSIVAFDEGLSDELPVRSSLRDRLAFLIECDSFKYSVSNQIKFDKTELDLSKDRLLNIRISNNLIEPVSTLCNQLGIFSLRAPILTCYVARAIAALNRQSDINANNIVTAAKLVLTHRATQFPQEDDTKSKPNLDKNNVSSEKLENDTSEPHGGAIPQEILLDSIKPGLSPEVLNGLTDQKKVSSANDSTSGSGRKKNSSKRGKPLPSVSGKLDSSKKLDLVGTLRASAPWQAIRKTQTYDTRCIVKVRSSDIRIKRNEERSDRLIIFAVDASGTAALGRLAEAKGAIEILLSEAYARRDQVSLIAFRGIEAEILLPPTRSLVQTKRRLSSLPGGGATPLASALFYAQQLSKASISRGLSPALAFLTDGRGNVALDGSFNRTEAQKDTQKLAQLIKNLNIPSLVIDTSPRPQVDAKILSESINASYLTLPRASSQMLSLAIRKATE